MHAQLAASPVRQCSQSATVADASVPMGTFTWITVPFSPAASVTAGTQYALVLSAPAGDAGQTIDWANTSQDTPFDFYQAGYALP
jgi:hypothetical protein